MPEPFTKEEALHQMKMIAKYGTKEEKQTLLNVINEAKSKILQKEIGIVCDSIINKQLIPRNPPYQEDLSEEQNEALL